MIEAEPLDFNNRNRYHIIYETQDVLKSVKLVSDYDRMKFYIADEMKFLKKGELNTARIKKGKWDCRT